MYVQSSCVLAVQQVHCFNGNGSQGHVTAEVRHHSPLSRLSPEPPILAWQPGRPECNAVAWRRSQGRNLVQNGNQPALCAIGASVPLSSWVLINIDTFGPRPTTSRPPSTQPYCQPQQKFPKVISKQAPQTHLGLETPNDSLRSLKKPHQYALRIFP